MGGRRLSSLLLGLLSLLSGALPPGEAQERLLLLPSDSPVTTSRPFPVSPVDLGVSSGVSVPPDVTGPDTVNAQSSSPSSSTVSVTESYGAGSDVTAAGSDVTTVGSDVTTVGSDVTGASNETTSDPSAITMVTGSRDATSADVTEPRPPNQTSSAEDKRSDPATQTPALLATLRSTKTPGDDSTPVTATAILFQSTLITAVTTSTVTSTEPRNTQSTAAVHTTRAEVQRGPSVLEVGDEKDLTSYHPKGSSNPLFVMIVSVFTIMVVMLVVVVGFHRYKKRNSRTEFRRLQDLPMDDMMEDTPLSLYSY
ncbi:uncharacterized protein RB166_017153 [Leptodactylus fuscus]|uniref:uncharacterized protein LOC142218594 n=1 Tax=Leptodactylus fuscus TaxID=238119 RepID=UPI003F4E9D27